ncbi:MAG: phage tail tube protein [Syntrophobacter sp.]
MLTRKTVVLAKIESVYGTDPLPTPSADAIAVSDLNLAPAGEMVERNILRGTLSPARFGMGTRSIEATFRTELKGSGTRGALPAWGWEGVLLRACGMAETVNAGAEIVYMPASGGFGSCTLYVYRDRLFHKVTGCRGSVKIIVEAGRAVIAEWKFKGLYDSPADASPLTPVFSAILPPCAAPAGFTINGFEPVAEKLELDLNNIIAGRKNMTAANGIAGFEITGRKPQGSFDPEAVVETAHPFWGNWANAASLALNLSMGTSDGNRFSIEAPALQYRDFSSEERDGRALYQVPFSLATDNSDDELVIRFS